MKLEEKQKHFNKGIELFNSQKFYEAHEEWEKIWLQERGELRDFYQGLIILAGAFYHVQKGRLEPAKKALEKSSTKLSEYRSYPKGAPFRGKSYTTYIQELCEQIDIWQKLLNKPQSRKAALRGRLHPALSQREHFVPVEGATRAPMIDSKDWPQLHGQLCHK